jgi:hypothetical protein
MKKYLIFIFTLSCLLSVGASAQAATNLAKLRLIADDDKFTQGEVVHVGVRLESANLVNVTSAFINFDPSVFELVKINKSNSIVKLWLFDPKLNGGKGRLKFGAGFIYPGFAGGGELFSFDLKYKVATTTSQITVTDEQILSADGTGANFKVATNTISIVNLAKTIVPVKGLAKFVLSAPLSSGVWNNQTHVGFYWPAGFKVLYALDNKATTKPTKTLKNPNRATFDITTDGTYYLHLQITDAAKASKLVHFKIQIDAKKPTGLTIKSTLPKKVGANLSLKLNAADKHSGLAYYSVVLDGKETKVTSPSFVTPIKTTGNHRLLVRAFDRAGNYQESTANFNLK